MPLLEDEYYGWLLQTYDRIINHEHALVLLTFNTNMCTHTHVVFANESEPRSEHAALVKESIALQAFTVTQKQRVAGWKRAMRKVCSPPVGRKGTRLPHASVLLASGSTPAANQQSPQARPAAFC
uniref:Uncharacterized protein n=1 Tax=Parascaris equorum TaxID=6256 RepID=A0A914S631_PAREQ